MTIATRMDRRLFTLSALLAGMAPARAASDDKHLGFRSGGRRVTVEWFAPEGLKSSETAPAVLLLHGAEGLALAFGYRAAARQIAANGIGVAFVHYFERTGDKSASLERMRTSFPPWSQAIRDALTWLGERPGIDRERLGIVGISLGAGLALHVAANGEARIKAIVDFFGPVSAGVLPKEPKLPPTLILHGANDQVVPVVHARTLEAWLKRGGVPYEIKIYPAQGHGFSGLAQKDAAARSAAFLAKHLGAKTPTD